MYQASKTLFTTRPYAFQFRWLCLLENRKPASPIYRTTRLTDLSPGDCSYLSNLFRWTWSYCFCTPLLSTAKDFPLQTSCPRLPAYPPPLFLCSASSYLRIKPSHPPKGVGGMGSGQELPILPKGWHFEWTCFSFHHPCPSWSASKQQAARPFAQYPESCSVIAGVTWLQTPVRTHWTYI